MKRYFNINNPALQSANHSYALRCRRGDIALRLLLQMKGDTRIGVVTCTDRSPATISVVGVRRDHLEMQPPPLERFWHAPQHAATCQERTDTPTLMAIEKANRESRNCPFPAAFAITRSAPLLVEGCRHSDGSAGGLQ